MYEEKQAATGAGPELQPMRDFKSRMFIMIFRDKERLLTLYNAMSGRAYTDPEELTLPCGCVFRAAERAQFIWYQTGYAPATEVHRLLQWNGETAGSRGLATL